MPPVTMLIKPVSNLCNMRCKYCFYADVSKHRETASYGIMSDETLETLVRKAFYYADDVCAFGFQGGEPTLAGLDFFERLLRLQKQYAGPGVRVSNMLQTNGYMLDEKWAAFFVQNNFLIGLSMDGTKHIHDMLRTDAQGAGTYDRVQQTAEMFREYGVQYNILCVVNNEVASAPKEVYSSLRKHKFLQFIPCLDGFEDAPAPYSLDAGNYARFLKVTFDGYYRDFMRGEHVSVRNFDNYIGILMGNPPEQCGMGGVCGVYFMIEADGSVFPCDFYVLDEWKLGNIGSESFSRMMKNGRARDFVEISGHVHPDCVQCKWFRLCRGGCRRYREPVIAGKPSLNVLCGAYKSFFDYAYERMREMSEKLGSSFH